MALKRNRPSTNCIRRLPNPSRPLPRTSLLPPPSSLLPRRLCSARRMEHFLDGHHVRLQSRARGMYLHADEDGRGVSLQARWASHNAAWAVHLFHGEGTNLVLLQGAAYGRYLSSTGTSAQPGHRGLLVEQRDFYFPAMAGVITWQVVSAGAGNNVMLRHVTPSATRYLRANGRYLQWHRGVTIEGTDTASTMMHWTVQPIPPRDSMPPLPVAVQPVAAGQERTIWYVRAGPDGRFSETDWEGFRFTGRSVANLRSELAQIESGREACYHGFAMCVRAGLFARLAPIVVDLPLNDDPIRVVMLMPGTPAIQALRHPNVNAEYINPNSAGQ